LGHILYACAAGVKEADVLQVEDLSVFYGDIQVLWQVSFRVEQGEIVSILGPNGAGKTTLMRTISGLLRPAGGSLLFDGRRLDRLPPYAIVELGVVQVAEARQLFPEMSVAENLDLGAYLPAARAVRGESLAWVEDLFPILAERRRQVAGTLSGGQQQMLAIGRALMSRPRLLMLDEPSMGLAPRVVLDVFGAINRIHEQGIRVLLVEQNVHQALKISDRVYVLETGRVVHEGHPDELLADRHIRSAYLGV
jgi:branched-chain amino acid transport system ATP-binding protein